MKRFWMVLWGVLLAMAVAGVGHTQESGLRPLATADDSRGWGGVGRLDLGRGSFCTAALVAEDRAVTAAHCLFDADTGERLPDDRIRFLAGFRDGRAEAYRGVSRSVVPEGYRPDDPDDFRLIGHDLALIELDRPIRTSHAVPFATAGEPGQGDEVGVVSYAHDRAERPSLQEMCHVLGRRGSVLVLSCEADFGSSGAPIFVIEDEQARIVSVVSAKARVDDREVSLASAVDGTLAELDAMLGRGDGVFHRAEPPVRRLSADEAREMGGAKFVRP